MRAGDFDAGFSTTLPSGSVVVTGCITVTGRSVLLASVFSVVKACREHQHTGVDGCGTLGSATQVIRYNVFQINCRVYSNGDKPTLWFYNNVIYCPEQELDLTLPEQTYLQNNIISAPRTLRFLLVMELAGSATYSSTLSRPTDPDFVAPGTGDDTRDSVLWYQLRRLHQG
jgi:hypothetical protein